MPRSFTARWARARRRYAAAGRASAGVTIIAIVQAAICALAALPAALGWLALLAAVPGSQGRTILVALLAVPTWCAFALTLMVVSPMVMRVAGGHTPAGAAMRISDVEWRLMHWCHHAVATHLVRVFAGSLFRGSPLWSVYLRLNGARVGRRVYVNSVHLADHHLLDLGDDVVVGAEAHLSGHTVERGVVRTGAVRVGAGATIGIGSIVEIGADVGAGCVVGALTFVPKFATLTPGAVYAGIPARVVGPALASTTPPPPANQPAPPDHVLSRSA
jgi:acetyltransferase-like isoleucine patch superfamily enzyme